MTDLRTFDQIGPADAEHVGGKGLSLGLMASAGLPVPPGFCVTSAAYRRCRGRALADQPDLAGPVADAYRVLGGGPVAVRSSATAEDGSAASFAGQQETFLHIDGEAAVLDAVQRCWASLDTDRAVAYRRKQGISDDGLAMAVVVQRLVPTEVAGVLFTKDPLDATGKQMLVEASWGLGEAVVSGRVTPDRFALDRVTGAVLHRQVSTKAVEVTRDGERPVPPERQSRPCLDDARLAELADLGRKVETFYGAPRDVEWAWADGRFWLLQARPITTADAGERERARQEEIAALRARAEPTGTVWARFNLSESLPEPTPLTWSIVRRFMSGRGGFGLMYRDLGFDPDPALDDEGIFDLVCGRPYCNLSREARLYYRRLPYAHNFEALKKAPFKALYPQPPALDWTRVGCSFWFAAPVVLWRSMVQMARALRHQKELTKSFPERFRVEIVPAFLRDMDEAARLDLTNLDESALLAELERLIRRVLYDFAREGLKPTALAAVMMAQVGQGLLPLGADQALEAVRGLMVGARPDADNDLPGALADLADGRLSRDAFLERFGHRGSQEMELSLPRWAEDHAALDAQLAGLRGASHTKAHGWEEAWRRVAEEAKLTGPTAEAAKADVAQLHDLLGLREAAKHHQMRGFAAIRRVLRELDRRYRLDGGVFYLSLDELPRLVAGEDFAGVIAERRKRRRLLLSLEVPPVLFSDDLDAIGRPPPPPDGATNLPGVPLSAGVAEAPALVLDEPPQGAPPPGPYVLVCPSTDPAWVPLFVNARALVMETGGVLSHGAIVAREFGLPAVAGLSGVTRRLKTGQRLRVDGGSGVVTVLP
jgi:pyruvate,water dikinase